MFFSSAAVLIVSSSLFAQAPQVYPPGSVVDGKSIGEWTGEWWEWVYAPAICRYNDPTGEKQCEGQSGPVFFLTGTTRNNPISPDRPRRIAIPSGKKILIPFVNFIGYDMTPSEVPSMLAELDVILDLSNIQELWCNVDGQALSGLEDHRETSETFQLYFPPGNCRDMPSGDSLAMASGFWVMLEPLSEGDHPISFKAVLQDPAVVQEVHYMVTVTGTGLFGRSDVNRDGTTNVTDMIVILNALFLGGDPLTCPDAADTNDDGKLDLSDAVFGLSYLYLGGPEPPEPHVGDCCGDPTEDELSVCTARC